MTHDPLCPYIPSDLIWDRCECDLIAKVRADANEKALEVADRNYRTGYNDGVRSTLIGNEMYGPKEPAKTWPEMLAQPAERMAEWDARFNQHGQGENP